MFRGYRLALTVVFVVLMAGCRSQPPYSGDWRDLRHGEKDSRWGFVDASGRWAIEPRFVDEGHFAEGLAWAVESSWHGIGYIDKTGVWAIKPQFRHATEFSEDLAAVEDKSGRWGYIDPSGRWVIAPSFASAQPFSEGLAAVEVGATYRGPWGFIDKTGDLVIPARYEHSPGFLYWKSRFKDGVALIDEGTGWDYDIIDSEGRLIKSIKSDSVAPFRDGLALARIDHGDACGEAGGDVFVYLDQSGERAFDKAFCGAHEFSDGMAAVWKDGLYGYIDRTGAWAIPPSFIVVTDFGEGLAAVKRDGRDIHWNYIDKSGSVIIAGVGDGRAEAFKRGLASLDLDTPKGYLAAGAKWGYIDTSGRVVAMFTKGRSFGW
jgi:WG containing repeat